MCSSVKKYFLTVIGLAVVSATLPLSAQETTRELLGLGHSPAKSSVLALYLSRRLSVVHTPPLVILCGIQIDEVGSAGDKQQSRSVPREVVDALRLVADCARERPAHYELSRDILWVDTLVTGRDSSWVVARSRPGSNGRSPYFAPSRERFLWLHSSPPGTVSLRITDWPWSH